MYGARLPRLLLLLPTRHPPPRARVGGRWGAGRMGGGAGAAGEQAAGPRLLFPGAADPPPGSAARRWAIGGGGVNLCPLSIGLPSLGGARGSALGSGGRWRRLARHPFFVRRAEKWPRSEAASSLGRFSKFSSRRVPTGGWGPHLWSRSAAFTLRALRGKAAKGPQEASAPGRGSTDSLCVVFTPGTDRVRKGLGREVTWNQLNSCTCLVLTFESSPRCPAFFFFFILGSLDMSATGGGSGPGIL